MMNPPPPLGGPSGVDQGTYSSHTADVLQVVALTADSLSEKEKQHTLLLELEAKKRAFAIAVPTLVPEINATLRSLGQPIRLFGEDPADVRQRLRMILARNSVMEDPTIDVSSAMTVRRPYVLEQVEELKRGEEEERKETTYTHAPEELVEARRVICQLSLQRAKKRLERERHRRSIRRRILQEEKEGGTSREDERKETGICYEQDRICRALFQHSAQLCLEGSQYGDTRPMSALCSFPMHNLVITGGWSGAIKVWDASTASIGLRSTKLMAHQDRIMGISSFQMSSSDSATDATLGLVATSSIDLTAKIWKVVRSTTDRNSRENSANNNSNDLRMEELFTLKGHQARLCKTAFHPTGRHVFTTSFDTTWRLWDVETGSELLLQDGHDRETYGVGLHPDGSLCAVTDFGGVVNIWDLRSGKAVIHFLVRSSINLMSLEGTQEHLVCVLPFTPNMFWFYFLQQTGPCKTGLVL